MFVSKTDFSRAIFLFQSAKALEVKNKHHKSSKLDFGVNVTFSAYN